MTDWEAYRGIADTEGIECILPGAEVGNDKLYLMSMRCRFNPQRKAVVYQAILPTIIYKEIMKMMDEQEYRAALVLLKEYAVKVGVIGAMSRRLWEDIPSYTCEEMRPKPNVSYKIKEYVDSKQLRLL